MGSNYNKNMKMKGGENMTQQKNTAASAGVVGAIIGAGVTAAAMALADKKNRDITLSKLNDVKAKAAEMLAKKDNDMDDKMENASKAVEGMTNEAKKNISL